jgi:hypothetical protein
MTEMHPSRIEADTTFRQPSLKVTFDTNTLSGVVDPDEQVGAADHRAYQAVHNAVKTGQIRGFFSETVVTLDAIGRKAKADVLGAARLVSTTASTGPNQITIKIGPRWKHVDVGPWIRARIEAACAMGMRALIGPRRFGDSLTVRGFGEGFYEPLPPGAAFVAAADTANALDAAIVARGLGRAQVIGLAKSFSERDGASDEWWLQGLERTRSTAERKKVRRAVNEWADGEVLAAHAGYGNDLFCTHDSGGDLSDRSILHPSHRVWLSEAHGVTFINIAQLAERLTTAP